MKKKCGRYTNKVLLKLKGRWDFFFPAGGREEEEFKELPGGVVFCAGPPRMKQ